MSYQCEICSASLTNRAEYWTHLHDAHTVEQVLAARPAAEVGHTRQDKSSRVISIFAVVISVVSAAFGGFSACTASQADDRVDRLEREQFANEVYLGEAPQYFYEQFKIDPRIEGPTWVVMNASGTEIFEVWIEGDDNTRINIEGVQRCTAYSLPKLLDDGRLFDPGAVHFKDPHGSWKRDVHQPLTEDSSEWNATDDGDSSYSFDIRDCSG